MASLYYSCCCVSTTSPFHLFPAKTPLRNLNSNSSAAILCTPSLTLRSRSSFARPISAIQNHPSATQKYVYPDPIPEFADFETQKFRTELLKKLFKDKETFGDDLENVVEVCSKILSEFLQKEYGGPGTLLVEPFTDMLVALKERKLPGAPLAARTSLLWAQNNVDWDWEVWISDLPK